MSNDSHTASARSWHEHAADAGAARARRPYDAPMENRPPPPTVASNPEPELKAKLLADWQLVKRARFHAASRLEQRNSASLFTLSMVALYGGLITVFVLIFKDSLSAHARSICDWISVVANWLTLTFSLTEQIKDYRGQARALHECGQKVNALRKHLQATPISTPQQLNPFIQAYEAHIAACGPNHDGLDYEIARFSGGRGVDGLSEAATASALRRLRLWSRVKTYAIYVIMCSAPAVAGLLAWLLVPAAALHGN